MAPIRRVRNIKEANNLKVSTVRRQSNNASLSNRNLKVDARILLAYHNALNKRNDLREKSHNLLKNDIEIDKLRQKFVKKVKVEPGTTEDDDFLEQLIRLPPRPACKITFPKNYNHPKMRTYVEVSENVPFEDAMIAKHPFVARPGLNYVKFPESFDSSMFMDIIKELTNQQDGMTVSQVLTGFEHLFDCTKNSLWKCYDKLKDQEQAPIEFCRICFMYCCRKNHPQLPMIAESSDESLRKEIKFATQETVDRHYLSAERLHTPCVHSGPCTEAANCDCYKFFNFCETYCQCNVSECGNRFRGCKCSVKCKESCACRKENRECIVGICKCPIKLKLSMDHKTDDDDRCFNSDNQTKRSKDLNIAISTIKGAGWGVFANEPIEKNAYIGEYTGELIDGRESDRRHDYCETVGLSYQFTLVKDEAIIDPMRLGSVLKFVNDSNKPNTIPKVMTVNGDKRICFYALKDIKKGEELFFDYGWDEKTKMKFFKTKS